MSDVRRSEGPSHFRISILSASLDPHKTSFQEVSLVQQTCPQTSPQQTLNTVSAQKPSLAQENIPLLTEIEEVTLGSQRDDAEMKPCIKEELERQENNTDLEARHALVSPGVELGFCSSSLPSSEVHERRKPMSETIGNSSDTEEVIAEQFKEHCCSCISRTKSATTKTLHFASSRFLKRCHSGAVSRKTPRIRGRRKEKTGGRGCSASQTAAGGI